MRITIGVAIARAWDDPVPKLKSSSRNESGYKNLRKRILSRCVDRCIVESNNGTLSAIEEVCNKGWMLDLSSEKIGTIPFEKIGTIKSSNLPYTRTRFNCCY